MLNPLGNLEEPSSLLMDETQPLFSDLVQIDQQISMQRSNNDLNQDQYVVDRSNNLSRSSMYLVEENKKTKKKGVKKKKSSN